MDNISIKLSELVHGRSGDKGDKINIALICHKRQWLPLLESVITPELLAKWFKGWSEGPFEVFPVCGVGAVNCLIHNVLQGGGTVSKRIDAQGKAVGQVLLGVEIAIDSKLAKRVGFDPSLL
ncbi:MAG TPA: hypothetical protein EYQ58_06180 [Candidatus Poseidoniales archaeon]|nr:hypothetical protein [Candidatus Poseidoniales archaeon]